MNQMRDQLIRFMTGRYGADKLGKFLTATAFILFVAGLFIKSPWVDLIAVAILLVSYYRMFSRNIRRRFDENQKFERFCFAIVETFRKWRFRLQQSIKFHIYKCPGCGQKIRVPRGKGKIKIHCPKCNTDFIKKS